MGTELDGMESGKGKLTSKVRGCAHNLGAVETCWIWDQTVHTKERSRGSMEKKHGDTG